MKSVLARAAMTVVTVCGIAAVVAVGQPATAADTLLSVGQPATASSTESPSYPASYADDGNTTTRWSSVFNSDPQWIYIDLGRNATINRVVLSWEKAFAVAYSIQISVNGTTWASIYSTTTGDGGTDDVTTTPGTGRYVRMYGTQRGCTGCSQLWGYSLYEFGVYGTYLPLVKGGYYLGGNADITPDTITQGMNLTSMTTYRSLYDKNVFPGYNSTWINTLMSGHAVEPNFVIETKEYGGPPGSSITCNGSAYSIPVADTTAGATGSQLYYGYDQILNHSLDGLLCNAVNQLNAMPQGPLNVQFESERDTKHQNGITQAGTAMTWAQADAASIPAIQYEMSYFRTHTTRVPAPTFTAGMGGFNEASFVRSYVPGVDYIQFNAYNHNAPSSDPYTVFDRTYAWLSELPAAAATKQVIIAEWGTNYAFGDEVSYIEATPAAIAQLPRIRMTNYFNSGWGLLSPKQPGLDALKLAYSERPYTAS